MTPADLAGMLEMMAQALRMLPAGGLSVPVAQPAAPAVAPAPAGRALADWLDMHDGILLTRGYKAQTIKNRRSNLAHVRRLWGTVPVAELKPHAVASALRTFPKEKSSTAVRVLSELRDAYVEAIANGWAETNPARDIKPPKHKVMRERLELEVWMQMRTLAQASPQRWVESMLLLGLAIGGGLGLVLGLLTGSVRWLETLLDSTIQMVRNIPALALIPLVILWFGIEESAKLFLISVAVFFPIYINTFHGIRNVDPGLIEMGRTYGLSRWGLYCQIILPGAMSSILVGLRFSLGLMWVILIVAETISAQAGIGYLTMNAREFLQTDVVLVGILLYAALGKLADVFAKGLEKYWLRWHPGYQ